MKTKIVLIVGPSGVGKDTLLKNAKIKLNSSINFVNRYITRKPDINESNFYLDYYAFEILKNNSFFISTWKAHENYYGIAKNSIVDGVNVISISRSKVKDFENIYDDVYTINVSVSKIILEERLFKRGRETKEEIEKRLSRKYDIIDAKKLVEFDNSKDIESSSSEFIKLLKSI